MRTKKSLKNALSMIIFNLIIGALGFLKVRVFIHGLSNDIYSLNQLFYQIFSYLAITDIGFELLLNKALYKALAKDDKEEVNKIYSTSRKYYSIVAIIMMGIALAVSFFVKYLTKADVNPTYMQIVFIIFIIRNVIDYFFVAPRYVLEADQQIYKVNHLIKGIKIIETIVEIVLVLLGVDYLLVLLPGIALTVVMDIIINKKIYAYYPWLKDENSFNKKYLKGTRDIVWRKVAGLLNSNTDIILISTFINPISVIIYTSYTYITKFITDTIYLICNGILPSFANVIVKESKEKSYNTFNEIYVLFLFLAAFIFIMLYGFLNPLINFWIGSDYLVGSFSLILFCFIAFQLVSERAVIMVINSKGLFNETKMATIMEAALNLILSLTLIHTMGLNGVLLGTIVAKILTSFIQNPTYIYKNIFDKNPIKYYIPYIITVGICALGILVFNFLNMTFTSVFMWIVYVVAFAILVIVLLFIIFYALFKPFRDIKDRAIELVKSRNNNK